MNLVQKKIIRGYKPLCCSEDGIVFFSQGTRLIRYNISLGKMETIVEFPSTSFKDKMESSSFFRRLFRLNSHCACPLDKERLLVSRKEGVFVVNWVAKTFHKEQEFQYRPLSFNRIEGVSGFEDGIYFGEYGSNHARQPIAVWFRSFVSERWEKVFTFPQGAMEHIHTLVPDVARECIWILTGDYEDAPAIYQAKNNFQEVKPILKGKQIYRSCVAFPTKQGLLYATDTHLENNSIRKMVVDNEDSKSTELFPLKGSCIYGTRLQDHYFFSTSCEPGAPTGNALLDLLDLKQGKGILGKELTIVSGTEEEGFHVFKRFPFDWLPKRLFQFSTIFFPETHPNSKYLVFYCVGVKQFHDTTFVYELKS